MRRLASVLTVVALCTLAACGDETAPAAQAPSWSESDLIGSWDVGLTGGERLDATFTDDFVELSSDCGDVTGAWVLDRTGRFVGTATTWPSKCDHSSVPDVAPWLFDATRVERTETGITLSSADGSVLATLSGRSGAATDPSMSPPPAPTAKPAGARPAGRDDLIGGWDTPGAQVIAGRDRTGFTVQPDGRWIGSDGCNGVGGLWALDEDGSVDVWAGGKTLMGCAGTPAADQFGDAAWAFLDGTQLVIFDDDGAEITRLDRVERPAPTTGGSP